MARKAQALALALFVAFIAIAACGQEKSSNRIVSEKLIAKFHPSGIPASFKVSPDSKRIAYVAGEGSKWRVVVDGKEEKQYDATGAGPIFSPDNRRVAYAAGVGNKSFVVVDEIEGTPYYAIISMGGGRIVFDRPDSFHYLVQKDSEFYLVEERIE